MDLDEAMKNGPGAPVHLSAGKTLRDEFAMAALNGLCADFDTVTKMNIATDRTCGKTDLDDFIAKLSYGFADAMLRNRTKG